MITALLAAGSALGQHAARGESAVIGGGRMERAVAADPPFDVDALHAGCPDGSRRTVELFRGTWLVRCKDAAGKLQGLFVSVHANGSIASRGEYRDGREVGVWLDWREGASEPKRTVHSEPGRSASPAAPSRP
jgi:hypothetical protein